MRFLALTLAAFFVIAGPARADQAAPIQAVIEQQLEAFQRDDAETAFSFASPRIQQQFGTAARFMTMVRQGYDPVYRPISRAFQDAQFDGNRAVQEVLLQDRRGKTWLAIYLMQQEEDGSWRIAGVRLVEAPAPGA
ncbi:MAG: DUF4864 domain-containing protein [Pseudomonadota bacterium]